MAGRSPLGALPVRTDAGVPLQVVDAGPITGTPGALRATAAFLLVLVCGAALLWRYEPLVERSMDASMADPVRSTAYGVAAQLVVVFAGVILASKLSQYEVWGVNPAGLGLVLGVLALLLVGSLGFIVVGSTVVELGGQPNRLAGVVVGALIAGVIAVVTPTVAGLLWLFVVAVGVGGAVRKWVHASAVPEA